MEVWVDVALPNKKAVTDQGTKMMILTEFEVSGGYPGGGALQASI